MCWCVICASVHNPENVPLSMNVGTFNNLVKALQHKQMRYKNTIRAASAIVASKRNPFIWNTQVYLGISFRSTERTMANSAVWIDTDCGFDDLCAVSLLHDHCSLSTLKVAYISTVNGMTDPVIGAGVMSKILQLSGHGLDIACGVDVNFGQRHSISDADWGSEYRSSFLRFVEQHLHYNQGCLIPSLNSDECGKHFNIDDMILRISELDESVRLTLFCLGPLTNIAYVINKYPKFFSERVEKIILMGGAVLVKGNAPGNSEYNFYIDPDSAAYVLSNCKVPIVMLGLEVANDEALTTNQLTELLSTVESGRSEQTLHSWASHELQPPADRIGTDPLATHNVTKEFLRELILYNKDAASYDAIACYYLICPEAFTFELMNIAVDSQTGCTTIAVDRIDDSKEPPEKVTINLATSVCKTSYFNYLLRILR